MIANRKFYIVLIASAWIVLFGAIFYFSHHMITKDIKQLEVHLAIDNAKKSDETVLKQLDQLVKVNRRVAMSTDALHFFNYPANYKFTVTPAYPELFIENKMQYFFLTNLDGTKRDAKYFDLKTEDYMNFPQTLTTKIEYYIHNIKDMPNLFASQTGKAFFDKYDGKLVFVTIEPVSILSDEHIRGYLVLIKTLSKSFFAEVSQQLSSPVELIPNFTPQKEAYRLVEKDSDHLLVFRQIDGLNGQPIAVWRFKVSRHLMKQNRQTMFYHFMTLVSFSMIGVISMIILVVLFIRRQGQYIDAFARFFPNAFLKLLNKKTILDIALGNHSEQDISVLFLDIRGFTSLSEKMTSRENFDFLNNLLGHLAPEVAKHEGFVDKFIGDAIMALFYGKDHAHKSLSAGIALLEKLKHFNLVQTSSGQEPISIGIGINSGHLMLGIIGEGNRYEGTVISDVVNLSSRIEGLTKGYGVAFLIGESTYERLYAAEQKNARFIDNVMVKGKSKPTNVYEVFAHESQELMEYKRESRDALRQAWQDMQDGKKEQALAQFKKLYAQCNADSVAKHYIDLIEGGE